MPSSVGGDLNDDDVFSLFLRCVKLYVKADKKRKDGSSMNSVTDMSEQNMKKKYYEIMYRHMNIPKLRVSFISVCLEVNLPISTLAISGFLRRNFQSKQLFLKSHSNAKMALLTILR